MRSQKYRTVRNVARQWLRTAGGNESYGPKKDKRSSLNDSNGVVRPVGQRFFPLDRELGLLQGAYTPQVQEAMTRLGSRMSYSEACEELARLWKVKPGPGSLRQVTLRHGAVADTLIQERVAQLEATSPEPTAQPEQLVMCIDGAMVQVTSGEWREVKTMALGEFEPHWDAKERQVVTQTRQLSYFSRADTVENFSRLSLAEWQRRGGDNAHTVVAVQDGATWIQGVIDYHCPQATRIIDFAHAQGYLAVVGRAIYGPETEAFRQWYGRISRQLGHQPPQRTVGELRLLQHQHPDHPQATEVETAIRYLENRLSMIDYPHFRRQQLPIGSGIVESGHKVVMQKRMKQAGMRWAETSLNPMLALRTALCNQTWNQTWQEIEARVRQDRFPTRSQPKHPPTPASEPDMVTDAVCLRLTGLAERIAARKRHPWKNHRWVFPHRANLLHQK